MSLWPCSELGGTRGLSDGACIISLLPLRGTAWPRRDLVAKVGGALLEVDVGSEDEWHSETHALRCARAGCD